MMMIVTVCVCAANRVDKQAGTLLNFIRHVVMFTFQLIAASFERDGAMKHFTAPKQPITMHLIMALLSLSGNQLTLMCYAFGVGHCLQVIVRSLSPMTTLLVGLLFFGQRYSLFEAFGVVLLTSGVGIATYADSVAVGKAAADANNAAGTEGDIGVFMWWIIGVTLLFTSVLMTSMLTHIQSYGTAAIRHPRFSLSASPSF